MKLTEILREACVRAPLRATEKTAVITELVDLLNELGALTNRDDVLRAVLAREATRSTAIGYGLAVPHGKCSGCPALAMAVGRPAEPLEFEAVDGRKVNLVVLMVSSPEQTGPHIQALARVSRLMLNEDFRREVAAAEGAAGVYGVIRQFEDSGALGRAV